jgi:hypothetical protein
LYYKCCKVCNIKSDLFKSKIEDYKYKTQTQTDKAKDINEKDEDGGNKMIEEFEKHFEDLEQNIKKRFITFNTMETRSTIVLCLKTLLRIWSFMIK